MEFEITGMEGWKRRGVIWGVIGTISVVISHPPLGAIILGVLFGAGAGAASIALALRNHGRFTWILPYLGLGLTIACVLAIYEDLNPRVWPAIGSLSFLAELLASAFLGGKALKRLNQQHRTMLDVVEKIAGNNSNHLVREPPSVKLSEAFVEALPELLRAEARAAFQPVISAHAFRSLGSLPPEHSALSGAPLLDPSSAWPAHNGKALEFLCQINLADLPPSTAVRPVAGLLAFFYDQQGGSWGGCESDLGSSVILYQPDIDGLLPVLKPRSGNHPPLRKPIRFEKTTGFTPTRAFEEQVNELIANGDDAISERIDDLLQTLHECGPSDVHRLFSRPLLIQNDMDDDLRTASRAHGLPEDTEWTLLLQLDSDRDLGWCWGDAGILYFWVPSDDLAACRFDRPWVVLQCT